MFDIVVGVVVETTGVPILGVTSTLPTFIQSTVGNAPIAPQATQVMLDHSVSLLYLVINY